MEWQAADDDAVITFGDRRSFRHVFDNARLHVFPQQHDDFVTATQIEPAVSELTLEPRQKAREEQGIADALLDAAEHALAENILAFPIWSGEVWVDSFSFLLPERDARLVFLPPALVVAKGKAHHRAAPLCIEIAGS